MMSRPDFMSKQILLIESDTSKKLKFTNSNFVLYDEEKKKIILQHSCHKIFAIFVLGDCSITSVLIKNAKKYAFPITFLTFSLKPYFTIGADNKGNVLLRRKQYDSSKDLELAKHIVSNKVQNQVFLMNSLRYKTKEEKENIAKVNEIILQVKQCPTDKELLGLEGNAAKLYFSTYLKNIGFKGRRPRSKEDVCNLLFDIGYYYLYNFIEANLELYGFDIYAGFYHKYFFQRKSLVCDIIEPFRCIIDKRIKTGYNLKQINEEDFYEKAGQFYVKKDFSKKYAQFFLKEILNYKEEIFLYIQQYYRALMKEKKIEEFPLFLMGEKK